jgi:hypothetical protein
MRWIAAIQTQLGSAGKSAPSYSQALHEQRLLSQNPNQIKLKGIIAKDTRRHGHPKDSFSGGLSEESVARDCAEVCEIGLDTSKAWRTIALLLRY